MPKDDTTIQRYNELKTTQMAIKKSGKRRQENKQKATKNDKAPKDLIDQEF
jgi:hypothetical protein